MDAKQLAEIKAREQAATPGPWYTLENEEKIQEIRMQLTRSAEYIVSSRIAIEEDAAFIAHARTDIPALVAEVERLTEENGVLRSECKAHINKQAVLFSEHHKLKEQIANGEYKQVVHARWIEHSAYDVGTKQICHNEDTMCCSNCHHFFNYYDNCTEDFACCPYCGSLMDGKEPTNV